MQAGWEKINPHRAYRAGYENNFHQHLFLLRYVLDWGLKDLLGGFREQLQGPVHLIFTVHTYTWFKQSWIADKLSRHYPSG